MSENFRKYGDVFKEPELRAELSIDELVRRQIERTNISASFDKRVFAANVGVLKSLLPRNKRKEVEMKASEYLIVSQAYKYKYNCGIPIGTPSRPIMGSPELVEHVEVDWDRLYELVLDAFEESNISWKIEPETIELGRVEKKKAEPTPWLGELKEEKQNGDEEADKI